MGPRPTSVVVGVYDRGDRKRRAGDGGDEAGKQTLES
jgi:hypothetical protein